MRDDPSGQEKPTRTNLENKQMTTSEQSAAASTKTYSIVGPVASDSIAVGTDKKGRPYATLAITSSKGKVVKATAFGEKHVGLVRETVIAAEGKPVKLFGRYDRKQFVNENGETKVSNRFIVLWAGEPRKAKNADDKPAEQAPAPEPKAKRRNRKQAEAVAA
jgi:hypothetical protein